MQNADNLLTEIHCRGIILLYFRGQKKYTEKLDGWTGLISNGQQVIIIRSAERLNWIDSWEHLAGRDN